MAVLCRDLGLLFLCVPKTGCSAVADLLIQRYNGEWLPPIDVYDPAGNLLCDLKHGTVDQLHSAGVLTDQERSRLIVAGTTRHPYDWLLSMYYFGRDVYGWYGPDTDEEWVRRDMLVYEYAAHHELADYIRNFWTTPGQSVSRAWLQDADLVLHYEYLQDDFDSLMTRLGVATQPIPVVNDTKGRPKGVREHYTRELMLEVFNAFRYDFDRWKYEV